jgi:hypothetical protein
MNKIIVVLFAVLVSLPLAGTLAGIDGADPATENREMAPFPEWKGTWASARDYPAGFERWFGDHFAFRARLIRWYAESRMFVLGVSSSSSVLKGSAGWLFYADDGGIEDYANVEPLASADLASWREALVRAREWLRERGIGYVFSVAPDKATIYPEFVPRSIQPVGTRSRTAQLLAALQDTHVAAVYSRPELIRAKPRERLYFKTDTHWNDRGAWVAYCQIIDAVRQQVPATPPPWSRAELDPVNIEVPGQDLARMLGLARVLHETDLRLIPARPRRARVVEPPGITDPMSEVGRLVTEIADPRLPRAVIFRDSFASRLAPLLSEHFQRAVYLWQNDFDAQAVLEEHPDVVIQEIVSRHLYEFVASPELVPR